MNITQILSQELSATATQITAAVELLDDGATVPFIARYRKEATGGLDDTQLRQLAERLQYLRELEDRKAVVLKSIEEQGKLSDDLRAQIEAADNKTALEDLYLPYKPKRRTKAQIAREHGLQPLGKLAQLRIVQPTCGFFTVTGDKGDGRAVIQKRNGSGDLRGGGGEFLREDLGDVHGGPLDGGRLPESVRFNEVEKCRLLFGSSGFRRP